MSHFVNWLVKSLDGTLNDMLCSLSPSQVGESGGSENGNSEGDKLDADMNVEEGPSNE